VNVTLTLDEETGAYLERIAADQGRTPAEVATWIVTEDLRREQAMDVELVARLDDLVANGREARVSATIPQDTVIQRESANA